MSRKMIMSVGAVALLACLAAWLVVTQRSERLSPGMEPASDVRRAVAGRSTADVAKIAIEPIFPTEHPIVVRDRRAVAALLGGLRVAVRTKVRYGCSGPRLQVFWRDGKKSPYFYILHNMGRSRPWGEVQPRAYNGVVPPDWRVRNH